MVKYDMNKDGLDDIIIGGTIGQAAALYQQEKMVRSMRSMFLLSNPTKCLLMPTLLCWMQIKMAFLIFMLLRVAITTLPQQTIFYKTGYI